MPFYNDMNKGGSGNKNRGQSGSWDDEGTHYTDRKGKRPYGDQYVSRSKPERAGAGAGSSYRGSASKPSFGKSERPAGSSYSSFSSRGAKPSFGRSERPDTGDRYAKPASGDRYGKPAFGGGARPATGDRYGKPAFDRGARPATGERYGKPAFGGGARPATGERYGKPALGGGARPATGERFGKPAFDRGAKPSFSRVSKPYGIRAPRRPEYEKLEYTAPVKPIPAAPEAPVYAPVQAVEPELPPENLLCGRNPIREALKAGHDIEKLLVMRGELSGSAREIIMLAKENHVIVQEVDKQRLDDITRNHQGMIAFASAYQYSDIDEMLELAEAQNEKPFLILLDGITDPHNLGAIIRTAECVGAHGVIVPQRRSVGLTPAAVKASAGAVEHIKVARVTNLANTIEELKEKEIWAYAADMEGEDYSSVNYSGGVALVIGAEGEGVSRLVLEKCDKRVSLPMKGEIGSLNASVAAGVMMYEIMRSRRG